MAGFDTDKARTTFHIPEDWHPVAAIAIGYPGDPQSLPDKLRERELGPRVRKPLSEFVMSDTWGHTASHPVERNVVALFCRRRAEPRAVARASRLRADARRGSLGWLWPYEFLCFSLGLRFRRAFRRFLLVHAWPFQRNQGSSISLQDFPGTGLLRSPHRRRFRKTRCSLVTSS